ncbi:hypothetical protein B7494_g1707 [Chlorociboria aeruginascens]|nr:hypothetical protein B7494_g1707 [Chlorociboria aeruginascens]
MSFFERATRALGQKRSSNTIYESLAKDTESTDSSSTLMEKEQEYPRSAKASLGSRMLPYGWVASTFILLFLLIGQSWKGGRIYCTAVSDSSYETGFDTDIVATVPHISLRKYRFTGGLNMSDNGVLYRITDDTPYQYTGLPNEDVDANWERLESGLELLLSRSEAATKGGEPVRTMEDPELGVYRMTADVIHSLHCVNEVRKGLHKDYYYPNNNEPYFYNMHLDRLLESEMVMLCDGPDEKIFRVHRTLIRLKSPTLETMARPCPPPHQDSEIDLPDGAVETAQYLVDWLYQANIVSRLNLSIDDVDGAIEDMIRLLEFAEKYHLEDLPDFLVGLAVRLYRDHDVYPANYPEQTPRNFILASVP